MAESTTLETLVLEINSSAKGANEGITNLINPLRSLAKAVGTVVPALREMNRELKKMQGLKIPNIEKALSSSSAKKASSAIKEAIDVPESKLAALEMKQGAVTEAMVKAAAKGNAMSTSTKRLQLFTIADKILKEQQEQRIKEWQAQSTPNISHYADSSNMIPDEELRKLHPEWYTTDSERASNALANASAGGQASWASETKKAVVGYNQLTEAKNKTASASKSVTKAVKETKTEIKDVGDTAKQSAPKMSGFSKNLQMIGRILKTMILRTIIRNLIKSFSEAWNAAYEFSKNLGGSFADAVDRAHTMLTDVGVTLVQTVAPVFEALIPVIKVVADAISYLCSGIQYLLSLLGMTSDVTKAATSSIGKYASTAGKGGKATKNMLASWDQLNVIQSKGSGSGSGGASYKPGLLKNMVSSETSAIMQLAVGEAMLAIGLILACTGHIGLGIAAIAIGASAIVKTVNEDWKKLPKEIQNTLTGIMTAAGAAMLAVGLLVMGANPALGIGMIIAGVANLGLAVALNWDDIVDRLVGMMTKIGDFFVGTWNSIRDAIGSAWASVKRWAKDTLGIDIESAWGSVKSFFKDLWGSAEDGTGIAGWASNAWKNVSAWWETNVLENIEKEGVWGGVKGFFKGVWDEVSTNANNAWTTVNQWLDSTIGTNFEKEWGKIKPIFESIFGAEDDPNTINGMLYLAYQDVSRWWTTNVTDKMKEEGVWGGVKGFFSGLFGTEDNPNSISGMLYDSFQDVSKWWTTNVTDKVKENGAWGGVVGFFEGIIGDSETGLEGLFNGLWTIISKLWGDIVGSLEDAWSGVATWFHNNVTMPIGNFFIDCVNGILDGVNWLIANLNSITSVIGIGEIKTINPLDHIKPITENAGGAYGISRGDLFIANEAGAELVGSMNGKTTVANQNQIIEGIQKGVRDANQDQNDLLRQQNDLLRQLLRKETKFELKPTAGWGDFIRRSTDIWDGMTGG